MPKRSREIREPPDPEALCALFEHARAPTFGVEEELMVLDGRTLDLAPRARELIGATSDQPAFKLELPASQLEVVSPARDSVAQLALDLYLGRARLAAAVAGRAQLAAVGAHPFAAAEGELNAGDRYERIEREYGPVIRRQLICGLHVHVGLSGPERVVAVYNALRSHLPELAALAANAPMHGGRDTGMASVRPGIAGTLPRQGIPPAYESLRDYARDLAWGAAAGRLQRPGEWWWELRIHAELGTLEVRVADAQRCAADAAAVVATVCGLVLWLAARHDAGELGGPAPGWRIAENRWSAARHGVHGQMLDLASGAPTPSKRRLHSLLDELEPFAAAVGGGEHIARAHRLAERNGADWQRAVAGEQGIDGLMEQLTAAFLERPSWLLEDVADGEPAPG
jgi:carboxylate-amine ligase